MTLDGFSFVKTKQRYEIHIIIPLCFFVCMLLSSMDFKAQY